MDADTRSYQDPLARLAWIPPVFICVYLWVVLLFRMFLDSF